MSPFTIVPVLLPCIAGLFVALLVTKAILARRALTSAHEQDRASRSAQQPAADQRQQPAADDIVQPPDLDLDATSVEIASPTG